nr:MAG: chaperonin 10 Kd subunit [Bacteriophage sp.]
MLKIKKIKPMFTALITTMDKYEQDVTTGGLINVTKMQGGLKEYQTVLAVGGSVRDIKVGDLVCVNPARFAVRKHQAGSLKDGIISDNPVTTYNFDVVEMDDKQCLLLQDRDIDFIIEEFEEVPDPAPSTIIQPEKKLIV